jgi:putative ABC transport system substrate-binding protein
VELLKQVAPGVTHALVLRDPAETSGVGQFAVIQSVASSVGVEVSPVNVRDAHEIDRKRFSDPTLMPARGMSQASR